jgi:hypothetical protein
MKKLLLLPLTMISLGICAQMKAPTAVANAFSKKFADAKQVKWGKENAKEYEADFSLNGTKMSANFDLQGNWKETETEITVSNLPEAVVKSIKAKHPSATIEGASKIEKADGKIIYEADIKLNGKKKELELLPDGSFVK